MAPGRAEAIAEPAAADLGLDDRMIGVEAHAEQARVGALVLAEARDKPGGRGLGARAQTLEMRIVALTMATPPGSSPAKISALASAIASTLAKFSRCTGATVVMIATCGRTMRRSGVISPA